MSRPIRVLHVNLDTAGIGRYGLLFGDALGRCPGLDVVSVVDEGIPMQSVFGEVIRRNCFVRVPLRGLRAKLHAVRKIVTLIGSFRPDILHDSAGSTQSVSALFWLAARGRVPIITTEHDPAPHRGMDQMIHRRLARKLVQRLASHLVAHGPCCRSMLIEAGVNADRISILRHGNLAVFDGSRFTEIRREPNTILAFGPMRPNKGVELLPKIADAIHREFPDGRFVVAGSSRLSRDLERSGWPRRLEGILREMRRRDYFEIHDRFISDDEVGTFFRRAGISILPYLDATQSGVAMIAMALGSVVLATSVGDLPDVVLDGRTGFLADPTPQSLIARLGYMLKHPEEVRSVAASARRFALETCSWDRIAAEARAIYGEVTSRRNRAESARTTQ